MFSRVSAVREENYEFCIWGSTLTSHYYHSIVYMSYYVCTFLEECEGNLQQQFP